MRKTPYLSWGSKGRPSTSIFPLHSDQVWPAEHLPPSLTLTNLPPSSQSDRSPKKMAENHLPGIPKKQQLLKSVLCCPLPTTLGCPQATGFSSQAHPQLAGLDEPQRPPVHSQLSQMKRLAPGIRPSEAVPSETARGHNKLRVCACMGGHMGTGAV